MTQNEALEILKMGHNVFLTGPAGSGKTFLLNRYISYLQEKNIEVGITASTGIAATHMNGMTIHAWSGLGIKDRLSAGEIEAMLDKPYLKRRFLHARVLIIDEISMLHGFRLDLVDHICKAFKRNLMPFGGMQVVMCGDFFQLPPVTRNGGDDRFAYTSRIWQEMGVKICYLDEQYRQSDKAFLQVLNDIRASRVTQETVELLRSRHNTEVSGWEEPTRLFTHNRDVDAINESMLDEIAEQPRTYYMSAEGEGKVVDMSKNGCLAPEELSLKTGAMVMFVKNNFQKGYVNGTLGRVVDFSGNGYPLVETKSGETIEASPEHWVIEENGRLQADLSQVPLRLAWAITVHKSQGMSLDAAELDLRHCFVPGMGYVALSRVRSLDGIRLLGLNEMALKINPDVLAFDVRLQEKSKTDQAELAAMKKGERTKRQKAFLKSSDALL